MSPQRHLYDTGWQAQGACHDLDTDMFFPDPRRRASGDLSSIRAFAACRRCAVRAECLRYALETGQRYGIWGGTSEEQRQRMLLFGSDPVWCERPSGALGWAG